MTVMKPASLMRDGTIRCPNCDGTALMRKKRWQDLLSYGLLLAPTRMKCLSCGTFSRKPGDTK